jgi:hypothetical protein
MVKIILPLIAALSAFPLPSPPTLCQINQPKAQTSVCLWSRPSGVLLRTTTQRHRACLKNKIKTVTQSTVKNVAKALKEHSANF